MGADMVISILPCCEYSVDREMELIWAAHNMTEKDFEKSETWFDATINNADEHREEIIDDIKSYWQLDHRRDVACFQFNGIWYLCSGGLSWGDVPTGICNVIDRLNELLWDRLKGYAQEDRDGVSYSQASEIRKLAQKHYCDESYDIAIYDGSRVEAVEDGYWIHGHLWVNKSEMIESS